MAIHGRQRSCGALTTSAFTVLMTVVFMLGWAPRMTLADGISISSNSPQPTSASTTPSAAAGDHGPSNGPVIASSFTTSFANVTQGHTLNLTWTNIDQKYEPLSLSVRLINRTADNRANGFSVTLNARIYNTSSYSWRAVPYPLPYLDSGLYELEIRPAIWNLSANDASSLTVPVLARSAFFAIADQSGVRQDGDNSSSTSSSGSLNSTGTTPDGSRPGQLVTDNDHIPTGPNKVALALGLSIGLAAALGLTAVLIFLRRRHRKATGEAEKRRRRRFAYVID